MAKSLTDLQAELTQVAASFQSADSDLSDYSKEAVVVSGLKDTAETSRQAAVDLAKAVVADLSDYLAASAPVGS